MPEMIPYPVARHDIATKQYIRTLTLRPDSKLIAEYRHSHAAGNVWPEIIAGIRSVGVLDMDIYFFGNTLVMVTVVPADLDWDAATKRLAALPRQQEWENSMAIFQDADSSATDGTKWQPMERIFHLGDHTDNGIKY